MTDYYQPLFDHMHNEHNLVLHESELAEIIEIVERMNEKAAESIRVICDVEGCNEVSAKGEMLNDSYYCGYYCFCSKHSSPGPPYYIIKQSAIDREKTRKPDGTLP